MKNPILFTFLIAFCACNIVSEKNVKTITVSDTTFESVQMNDSATIIPIHFSKKLAFGKYSFTVTSIGDGSIQELNILPIGLSIINDRLIDSIDGSVSNAEIGDINGDGFPEVLVYTNSAGSGSYGNVIGYSCNNGKSMSRIYMPSITDNNKAAIGYMGHDEFTIGEGRLLRRYPIYHSSEPNSNPSDSIRQIQYKLINGEASRKFVIDKIIQFKK
ncbi:MAG: PliI family lysozyme inhibitor of I-type lysozyme [Sphingobacteriia bacterium]|jgi:hypothetical protein